MSTAIPLVRLSRTRYCLLFSDIHIGAIEHAEKQFDEALAWAKEHEAMLVLNGDIVENAIIEGSAAGEKILGQAKFPTEQFKIALDKFKPFAKRGKIAGITLGNHDARTRRSALLDLCDILSHALGVPYWGVGGLCRFIAGDQLYHGAIQHGRGGGKNIWNELDKLLSLYAQAEFAALGHNHSFAHREVCHLGVGKSGEEVVSTRHQIRTGSYLYYPSYVREMVGLPQPIGTPILRFGNKVHEIEVDTSTLRWYE